MSRHAEIGARRHAEGSAQGFLLTAMVCFLAAGGVAWVYMGMVTQEQWPVRWLEVDGTFERVSAEQIRASVAPFTVGSFFTVNLGAIRSAAFRQPWVAEATVQKSWPDTIRVSVREFTPVAHWTGDHLISKDGRAFKVPSAAEIQGLPWLSGPDGQLDAVFEMWKRFNNELMPAGLEIGTIRLDPRGSWFLELTNGTEIRVGREDAGPRLRRLVRSWSGLTGERGFAPVSVDLRYSNGFAVRWPNAPARIAGIYGKEN